jgi:RNA polymerase sigma-70 factor (ECF subfamily)
MARHETGWTQRIAAGERQAQEEFVDAFGARVHRLVRQSVVGADADDVTQEIFIDLFKSIGSFRGEAALATWVYRVALNHCARWRQNHARRTQRETGESDEAEIADESPDPARRAATAELRGQVHGAIANLSPVQRDAVILHELHGLTYAQCAAALEIPVGTVKSRLSNAFRALRLSLHDYVQSDEETGEPTRPVRGVAGGAA